MDVQEIAWSHIMAARFISLMGTAGILGGWALQGYSAGGHCKDTLPLSTAVRLRAEGGDNKTFKI